MEIADIGNAYFQNAEPWKNKNDEKTKKAVAWSVNLARNIAILVSPVLPEFSGKVYASLSEQNLTWDDLSFKWKGKVMKVPLLVNKLEKAVPKEKFPLQLAVGQVVEVNDHPNADSLYLLKVDMGKLGKRQVVAGLKKYLSKEDLRGRKVPYLLPT